MRIRRKIVLFLLLLVCFIVQGTFLKVIAIGSISPNLILIFVVSFGFMRGKRTGIWTGFVCGLCCDLLGDGILGYYALIYLLIGFGAGCCCKLFYDDELRVPAAYCCRVRPGLWRNGICVGISASWTNPVLLLFLSNDDTGNDLYSTVNCNFV